MHLTLIGYTEFDPYALKKASGYIPHYDLDQPEEMFVEGPLVDFGDGEETSYVFAPEYEEWMNSRPKDADELAEAAGRICYKSFDRPNPRTKENVTYLGNIIGQGHFSTLEHGTATFHVSGVSRNFLLELERHRHLSLSVLSSRYVDYSESEVVIPEAIRCLPFPDNDILSSELKQLHASAISLYERIFQTLKDTYNLPKKQARTAARAALLGSAEVEFVVTGNHRTYREVLQKRMTPQADREIYQFARELGRLLSDLAPNSYQDIHDPEGEW